MSNGLETGWLEAHLRTVPDRDPELRLAASASELPDPGQPAAAPPGTAMLRSQVRQLLHMTSAPVDRAELYLVASTGISRLGTETFPPQRWAPEARRLRETLEQGECCSAARLSPLLPGEGLALRAGMQSAWYLPLLEQRALIGVVAAYSALPEAFEDADATRLAPVLGILGALLLERQSRTLEQRIRHAQLELAATEKLGALSQLAEGIGHEINNPAAYVLTNLEHVRTLVEQGADAPCEMLRAIDDGVEGIRRIRSLVSDLGLLSRGTEAAIEAVDVNRVARGVVAMASHQVSATACVELDLGEVLPIASNKARLTQILLDIVLNASQACCAERREMNIIRIRTRAADGRVELSVSDTGSGIPPEQLPHIFEPFFTTKPAGKGSGLGLAVARALVRGLGGRIRFDTREGVGTTFTVELPDTRPVDDTGRISHPTPVTAPPRPRVLIVDDEAAIRRALQRSLGRHNEVIAVGSGEEAIGLLGSGLAVDFVLSDLLLPGKNGMDIHAFIQEQRPELLRRTLFLTGGATTPVARRFVSAHPGSVLVKPVEASRLAAVIESVAQGASVRRAIEQTAPGQ